MQPCHGWDPGSNRGAAPAPITPFLTKKGLRPLSNPPILLPPSSPGNTSPYPEKILNSPATNKNTRHFCRPDSENPGRRNDDKSQCAYPGLLFPKGKQNKLNLPNIFPENILYTTIRTLAFAFFIACKVMLNFLQKWRILHLLRLFHLYQFSF